MKKIRQSFILLLVSVAIACSTMSSPTGPLSTDPDTLARQVIDAMGGSSALAKSRFFSWKSGSRSYVWDRSENRLRVESRDGSDLIDVLMNSQSGTGTAYRNGRQVPPTETATILSQTVDRFASDSFWLFNATMTFDKGAHRAYAGEQEIAGKKYPTLQATFEGRPDLYWFHIDSETHLPAAWTVVLGGVRGTPTTYLYASMQKVGPLTLPAEYDQLGGNQKIVIGDLQILGSVDNKIFNQP